MVYIVYNETYHNHHTFIEPPLWNKNPKDVIQESTGEEHSTNLFMYQELKTLTTLCKQTEI